MLEVIEGALCRNDSPLASSCKFFLYKLSQNHTIPKLRETMIMINEQLRKIAAREDASNPEGSPTKSSLACMPFGEADKSRCTELSCTKSEQALEQLQREMDIIKRVEKEYKKYKILFKKADKSDVKDNPSAKMGGSVAAEETQAISNAENAQTSAAPSTSVNHTSGEQLSAVKMRQRRLDRYSIL